MMRIPIGLWLRCIHSLRYAVRECHGNGIRLDDASTSNCRHRVKNTPRELRVLCVDRFRNWDHVIDGCVAHGATRCRPSCRKLLRKIRNGSPEDRPCRACLAHREVIARTRCTRLSFPKLPEPAAQGATREPIDRAGAPVNLRIRIALRASGNMEELAIVGFRRFVYALGQGQSG